MMGSLTIRNVPLPCVGDASRESPLFDVYCENGKIKDITIIQVQPHIDSKPFWHPSHYVLPQSWNVLGELDAGGKGILLPS